MNKQINLRTLEDFNASNHAERLEIYEFWRDYGQPSAMPFWMERLITAIEHKERYILTMLPGNDLYGVIEFYDHQTKLSEV